jgi:hypothetical protein
MQLLAEGYTEKIKMERIDLIEKGGDERDDTSNGLANLNSRKKLPFCVHVFLNVLFRKRRDNSKENC